MCLVLTAAVVSAADVRPTTSFVIDRRADVQSAHVEWARELDARLPEIVRLWESVSPPLFEAVVANTRKPLAPPAIVHLTLTDQPSNSFLGITVNMRYALHSFTAKPVPMRYKIDTVFHEALHEFVMRNTPKASPLLAQHASEPQCVRNHLHLLALQESALLHTDQRAALDQVVAFDSQLPSSCYRRAWSLVNATSTTYRLYVDELSR